MDEEFETSYGHCFVNNPFQFIPDLECNTDKELLNWRHALLAVKQGTFECPEHYFWKEANGIIIHGHTCTWGLGINSVSDKVKIWEEYPSDDWVLQLALSTATDEEYLKKIKDYVTDLKLEQSKFLKELGL